MEDDGGRSSRAVVVIVAEGGLGKICLRSDRKY